MSIALFLLENAVHGNNGEMNDMWLFSIGLCVQGIRQCVRNETMHGKSLITIFVTREAFRQWLCICDCVTRELFGESPHWWPRTNVFHGKSKIILYDKGIAYNCFQDFLDHSLTKIHRVVLILFYFGSSSIQNKKHVSLNMKSVIS